MAYQLAEHLAVLMAYQWAVHLAAKANYLAYQMAVHLAVQKVCLTACSTVVPTADQKAS